MRTHRNALRAGTRPTCWHPAHAHVAPGDVAAAACRTQGRVGIRVKGRVPCGSTEMLSVLAHAHVAPGDVAAAACRTQGRVGVRVKGRVPCGSTEMLSVLAQAHVAPGDVAAAACRTQGRVGIRVKGRVPCGGTEMLFVQAPGPRARCARACRGCCLPHAGQGQGRCAMQGPQEVSLSAQVTWSSCASQLLPALLRPRARAHPLTQGASPCCSQTNQGALPA